MFENMISGAGTSRTQPPSSIRMVHAHGVPYDENIVRMFLNQLLSNLSARGAHIQVQFTQDPSFLPTGYIVISLFFLIYLVINKHQTLNFLFLIILFSDFKIFGFFFPVYYTVAWLIMYGVKVDLIKL